MTDKCERCGRYFATADTNWDADHILKIGKSYIKSERVAKWTMRDYCAFCGKWVK